MRDKEIVLAKYPMAYAFQWFDGWTVYSCKPGSASYSLPLGDGKTEQQAWVNAAKRITA